MTALWEDGRKRSRGLNNDSERPGAAHQPALEALRLDFEQLGLTGSQAKLLLALLQLRAATPAQLADISQLPRTRVYSVLESLRQHRLAEQVPGSTGVWASRGPQETVARLRQIHRERWEAAQATIGRAATVLEELGAGRRRPGSPYVHVLRNAGEVRAAYDRLLSHVGSELLVCNKSPYSALGLNPAVLAALARGARARALYEAVELEDPEAETLRRVSEDYHRYGVEGRVVPELPMKLVIADRRVALYAMVDPVDPDVGFPVNFLVEHPGFAAMQAAAFDHLWDGARPYDEVVSELRPPPAACETAATQEPPG